MRLFTGISIPEAIREEIRPLLKTLPVGRPTKIDNLHLTLKFLGEVPTSKFSAVKGELEKVSIKPFRLQFVRMGAFPSIHRAKILWLGLETSPELFSLFQQIQNKLETLGFEPESRKFTPHLTIARLKLARPDLIRQYIEQNLTFQTSSFFVNGFQLYSSRTDSTGAVYTIEADYSIKDRK